ncbi:DUF4084 domain-containing protein [Paenibacillus kandeliae]|uniref:DUF4084 domain-containing protein n=1 Tax=Paenibacillus kandeliae TaxID=3231269 RepID=UPI00345B298E
MPRQAYNWKPLLLSFIVLFTIVYYVWINVWIDNDLMRTLGGNILSVSGSLIATYWLFSTWKHSNSRHRVFWLLLSLGSFCYLIAEILWIYFENVIRVSVPFPGYSDVFYMLQVLFYMSAFFYKLNYEKKGFPMIRLMLDILIVMTVLCTFSWHFLLRSMFGAEGSGELSASTLLSIAYAITDLALVAGAASLYFSLQRTLSNRVIIMIVLGLLVQVLGDTTFLYMISLDEYYSGSLSDPLFITGILLVGFAGVLHKTEVSDPARASETTAPRIDFARLLLPYVGIVALFLFMTTRPDRMYVLAVGTGIAIILVLIRQLIILLENQRLMRSLYDKTQELATSEHRYKSIVEYHPDAIVSLSLDGRIESANPEAVRLYGLSEQELIGRQSCSFITEDQVPISYHYLEKVKKGEPQIYETTICSYTNEFFHVRMTTIPILVNDNIVGIYSIAKDITENRLNEEKIKFLAYHDPLTGLMNRAAFEDWLSDTVNSARSEKEMFSILFIDLDRFKNINDTLGHDVGDQLLRSVAQRLQRCVRENDIIARLGGDEFTLILRHMRDESEAGTVAQRILDGMNQPHYINGFEIMATPSIGIAVYPGGDDSAVTLMKKADIAMYQVKQTGKGHYRFYNENDKLYSKKLMLEKELGQALYRNELILHYQPQIDAAQGKVIGVEALIRWKHAEMGLVMPGDFIPVAEETGLIIPIGEWVLREACMQSKRWQDEGYMIKIGVNLSAQQFEQENFVDTVAHILKQTGVNPAYIDLEITESMAMSNISGVITKLKALKLLGVSISIDDFGTGYSSLAYLENFPVDKLKIAREFTSRLGSSQANHLIISSIVSLARNLNMNVIAEGVENNQQASMLQQIHCHEMQGYLFSKPVSAVDVEQMLRISAFVTDFTDEKPG